VWKFFHMCGAGTTSVEKPLPTFQLHGSIITASFHVAELGVMSQFIVYTFFSECARAGREPTTSNSIGEDLLTYLGLFQSGH
jgi:hypothetical protein